MRSIYSSTSQSKFEFYESRELIYQKLIENMSGQLFENWYCLPWNNVRIYSPDGCSQPDLALISKDLTEWGVVEVELKEHPYREVYTQLNNFRNGNYGDAVYENLFNAYTRKYGDGIPKEAIRTLCRKQPFIFCIVNEDVERFRSTCLHNGILYMVAEPYKNDMGQEILLVENIPPELTRETPAGEYELITGAVLDQNVIMYLPIHFPNLTEITIDSMIYSINTTDNGRYVSIRRDSVDLHGYNLLLHSPEDPSIFTLANLLRSSQNAE